MMSNSLLPLAFSVLAYSVSAAEPPATDYSLEPCINGAVSATGAFPTQDMEDQIEAYVAWSSKMGQPYYLFRVMDDQFATAYPER
jgi:hypothetical protein